MSYVNRQRKEKEIVLQYWEDGEAFQGASCDSDWDLRFCNFNLTLTADDISASTRLLLRISPSFGLRDLCSIKAFHPRDNLHSA
jgi:hypothetical protein